MNTNTCPDGRIAEQALHILGGWIRQQRKKQGISASEICERVNITPDTLESLEKGDPGLPMGYYLEVSAILKLKFFQTDTRQASHILQLEEKIISQKRVIEETREIRDIHIKEDF